MGSAQDHLRDAGADLFDGDDGFLVAPCSCLHHVVYHFLIVVIVDWCSPIVNRFLVWMLVDWCCPL